MFSFEVDILYTGIFFQDMKGGKEEKQFHQINKNKCQCFWHVWLKVWHQLFEHIWDKHQDDISKSSFYLKYMSNWWNCICNLILYWLNLGSRKFYNSINNWYYIILLLFWPVNIVCDISNPNCIVTTIHVI